MHDWEDISYHGSPQWQCKHCDLMSHEVKDTDPCPKNSREIQLVRALEATLKLIKEHLPIRHLENLSYEYPIIKAMR